MLKILFEAETENDYFTPISIANAILKADCLENEDVEEIAEHLMIAVKHFRKEKDGRL